MHHDEACPDPSSPYRVPYHCLHEQGQRANSHIPDENDSLLNSVLTVGSLRPESFCVKNTRHSTGAHPYPPN